MHSQNVDKESLISHIYKITIYFVKALQEGTPEKRKRSVFTFHQIVELIPNRRFAERAKPLIFGYLFVTPSFNRQQVTRSKSAF